MGGNKGKRFYCVDPSEGREEVLDIALLRHEYQEQMKHDLRIVEQRVVEEGIKCIETWDKTKCAGKLLGVTHASGLER